MLSRIFIKNFALIDSLDINLNRGLQVITGETGAGKSIILGALRLILGERADVKSIQHAETKSIVETEFKVNENLKPIFEDHDLDFETDTVIRREILPSGKSRAFINDMPVTLDVLRTVSRELIDIHSQFETSDLFNEDYQFRLIDGLSENKNLLPDYQKSYLNYKNLKSELDILKKKLSEGNREADYRNFLLNELVEADLDNTDLADLQDQLSKQENAETIVENLSAIFGKMDQEDIGILDSLNEVKIRLSRVAGLSHEFTRLNDRLQEAFVEFKDILFELQDAAENMETSPELLDALNLKVNTLNALLLKHQVTTVEELRQVRDNLAKQQSGFEELEEKIIATDKMIVQEEEGLKKFSQRLSANRKTAIPVFKDKIESLLKQLGLEKARIEFELSPAEQYNTYGREKIQLLFQANTGFPLKPIQSAISGGERSRVMLSIKKLMAESTELPTLILDEIDTGVSGKVAEEIGKVMQVMSGDMQLIVITHLAQVAAKGNDNYKVVKQDIDGRTQSGIISLSEEDKLQEIAQLLSGSTITDAAVSQAKELMK